MVVERTVVEASSRMLRSTWTLDAPSTFSMIYGVDLEAEMADIIEQEMASEVAYTVDQSIIDELRKFAGELENKKNKKIDHFKNESGLFEVT